MRAPTLLFACAAIFESTCAPPVGVEPSDLTPASISCRTFAVTRCERMDACTGGTWIRQFFGSRLACEQHTYDACNLRATAPGTSLSFGSIDSCTAALSDATCSEFFGGVAACRPAPGALENGDTCSYGVQCESAWCERAPGTDCGTCASPPVPPRASCGAITCPAPSVCVLGHCAIPIAAEPTPSPAAGAPDGALPVPDSRFAGLVQIAGDQLQCAEGCGAGATCVSVTVPSVSSPFQTSTRYACVPIPYDAARGCILAGLEIDPVTGACVPPVDQLPLAAAAPITGAAAGLATAADPDLAGRIEIASASQCESACAAGYTCLGITVPSVSSPFATSTRYVCAPISTAAANVCVLAGLDVDPTTGECEAPVDQLPLSAAYAASVPITGAASGLSTPADPRFAGSVQIASAAECEEGCAAGSTCLGVSVPSVSSPFQRSTRFGCAPIDSATARACLLAGLDVDPVTGACLPPVGSLPISAYASPEPMTGPAEGLTPPADPRLVGRIEVATHESQCDEGRGCGPGYACMTLLVPGPAPFHVATLSECTPVGTPDARACAKAGMVLNPATGYCQRPILAAAGEVCGASRPGVVCGGAGRCVRAAPGDADGVCVAAAPINGLCFADPRVGPGCMAPAYCARVPGAAVGTCVHPAPALCGR